jgi:glucose-1-phosphate thymidylyltransferase
VYMFTSAILDAARRIRPSWRNELEITDAIQELIDQGSRVEPHIVRGWWKDTGRLEDILEANRLILEDLERRVEGELIGSQVEGRVAIEAGARLERTVVRGPAIIGAGARLTDAYVGPYCAIAENVTIERSEVEHSIIMADSTICDLAGRVEASLIGSHVSIRRNHALPKAYRFMLGENSEVEIL